MEGGGGRGRRGGDRRGPREGGGQREGTKEGRERASGGSEGGARGGQRGLELLSPEGSSRLMPTASQGSSGQGACSLLGNTAC